MTSAHEKSPPKEVAAVLVSVDSAKAKEAAGSDVRAAAADPGQMMPPASAKPTVPSRPRPSANATRSTSAAASDERPRPESKRKAPTSSSSTKRIRNVQRAIPMRKYYRTILLGLVDLAMVNAFIIRKVVMRQHSCIPT
ncbi:hypothetical protein JG688_00007826 [Phytophthora aleatoria]|uniref:PiggyBac transposable element-derived protein domain-containing protein n=1 Tax=Phytophthora aleatoria TaxID=2496075 RepID=A0A8J5M4V7_9STRA|nr:hypothetical protein JG688_00007826 [Phytophthora aleatoria]